MLLYSTTLHINDTLTRDGFIQLVIQWNQSSPHEDNVIPNINWNGEHNIRFGNESLWLDIEEYRNKNIIAVRFEKRVEDGAIWDTDYIMNFDSMKMTIQLDRGYTEDAQMEDLQFATPHFISMLIDGGYLTDDNGIPVLRQAISITEDNLSLITDVINGQSHYRLPIVYVTKTTVICTITLLLHSNWWMLIMRTYQLLHVTIWMFLKFLSLSIPSWVIVLNLAFEV